MTTMKLIAYCFLLPIGISGFTPTTFSPKFQPSSFQLQAHSSATETQQSAKFDNIFRAVLPLALSGLLVLAPPTAFAEDDVTPAPAPAPTPTTSVTACRKNPTGVTNCVSTRNVKQLDLYAPPWTFDCSPDEAAARIKGVIASDPNLELKLASTDSFYFQIQAIRNNIFTDDLEILINPSDKVVTFRAEQSGEPTVSDFGTIRKELESIRQRGKVFGIMGQTMGAADTMPSQNGPIGQLKAFYGLQSGRGYEDVFEED